MCKLVRFMVHLQVMKGLVGRLQDTDDEVRVAAIEGVTAAAKHSLALLDGTLAPLNEVRNGTCITPRWLHVLDGISRLNSRE
jgi:hypothetical protein